MCPIHPRQTIMKRYAEPDKPRLVEFGTKPRTGDLTRSLRAKGIEAKSVIRNRQTGILQIRFGAIDPVNFHSKGTLPGAVWAKRITDAFAGLELVDVYDTVADWRPNKPVLYSTVYVRVVV